MKERIWLPGLLCNPARVAKCLLDTNWCQTFCTINCLFF
jgi:hypothetical protein